MGKDHKPSGFGRSSGYKSDLENSETDKNAVRVNTSFGSNNHNVYIHNNQGSHEHYYYDPATGKSGYHGENYPTKNNHPTVQQEESNVKVLSEKEYQSKLAELYEHIGYNDLTEEMQEKVDAKVQTMMQDRGYVVQSSNNIEQVQNEHNSGNYHQEENENNAIQAVNNSEDADEDADEEVSVDERDGGHPYSIDDDCECEMEM